MVVCIQTSARAAIAEWLAWYLVRSSDVSVAMLAEPDADIRQMAEEPEPFPVVYRRLRRVLLHRFPYAMYLKCYLTDISVIGVMHGNRHPSAWMRRAEP